tara:strand:+ start:288 stop:704 length:417 start_codon:yes stop_codon:yes gene_type:complete
MEKNIKEKSFGFVYWIMLLLLVINTIDTFFRFFFVGYLGGGSTLLSVDSVVKPTSLDLVVFLLTQVCIVYGIYLLYNLKKMGGYLFLASQLFFLTYTSLFGPVAEIGLSSVLLPVIFFFCLYFILTIIVPWFYSEKFN